MEEATDAESDSLITTSLSTPLADIDKKQILPDFTKLTCETTTSAAAADALTYWESQQANEDSVLGGYAHLGKEDIRGSLEFYKRVRRKLAKWKFHEESLLAADVGGGVGRVSKHLLLNLFEQVHIVEPIKHMRAAIPEYVGDSNYNRVRVIDATLESWNASCGIYDVIWLQWVCMFIDDSNLISALRRFASLLKPHAGVIILKENVSSSKSTICDLSDQSTCRSRTAWLKIFEVAGLNLVCTAPQRHWPSHLYTVQMFALIPS